MRDEHSPMVCLLGPVGVRGDGGLSLVAGPKLQSVLAMLALEAPRRVSDDRLVEEIWAERPPANAANALQAMVSSLRRLLGRTAIGREGAGYVLQLGPLPTDVACLEAALEQARDAAEAGDQRAAAARYREAVSLSRGPPLPELTDRWFAREAAVRLEELVLSAHEGLVEAELALGRHDDVREPLTDLVARHPLRERFQAQLALTLYRSGRQAGALQVLRAARRLLRDELGLEPGPELVELERAVLDHDPRLRAPLPLGTVPSARAPLPRQSTSFVGRERELALLDERTERLVTVTGPAGVGKTRVASEWARERARHVAVSFVELAPVQGPAVAATIAAGLGASEHDRRVDAFDDPIRRAAECIEGQPRLLVLDNCEHVTAAVADVVEALLRKCDGLTVVATSREPLGVAGEQLMVIEPLPPDASCRLFVDRARAVQPLFEVGDPDELSELCRHLDGLPLAIELAAARARSLPVPEITERLHDRFRLLRSPQRHVGSRHQGLGAAIDWSYNLLFDEERRTFRRLAVFSAGGTGPAIERVCGPGGFESALNLVDRSLVTVDTSGDEVRIGMLESLRAFGHDRLVDEGELIGASDAHLDWCAALADRVSLEARGPNQLVWLERLDREHDNVRAALAHAVAHHPGRALRLIVALVHPWWSRGRHQELRERLGECLVAAPAADPADRAMADAARAYLAEPAPGPRWPGELEDVLATAAADGRAAVDLLDRVAPGDLRTAGARMLLIATLSRQAAAGVAIDRADLAALAVQARGDFVRAGDWYGAAGVSVVEALEALVSGDLEASRTHTEAARRSATRAGDRYSASRVEYLLGLQAEHDQRVRDAYRHFERALQLLDELGMQDAVTAQARMLEPLAEQLGERDLAAQWRSFIAGRGGSWTYFDGTVAAAAHNRDGLAASAAGDLPRAAAAHRRALQWYQDADLPAGVALSESCLGFVADAVGDRAAASVHHRAAWNAAVTRGEPAPLALSLEGIAGVVPDPESAAVLLGAADARWRTDDRRRRPAALDGAVEATRARVHEALDGRFDQHFERGGQLELADVSALVHAVTLGAR